MKPVCLVVGQEPESVGLWESVLPRKATILFYVDAVTKVV